MEVSASLSLVYFIKSGEAAHVTPTNGADLVFYTTGEGSFFGENDFANSS